MNEDFEDLLKLFDYALSSDNPAVKKALKNLLLVVSIVKPQEEKPNKGPLHDLKRMIEDLKMQVAVMRSEIAVIRQTPNTSYPSYPPSPNTYPSFPGTYAPWIVTSTTGTSSSSTTPVSSSMTEEDIKNLLRSRLQSWNYKESIDSDDK